METFVSIQPDQDILTLLDITKNEHEEAIGAVESADFNHAGIKVVHISAETNLYIGLLPARTSLKNHYHRLGSEDYIVVRGTGTMHRGVKNQEDWTYQEPLCVEQGTQIFIPPNTSHQLSNTSASPMIFYFRCAPEHLQVAENLDISPQTADWCALPDADTLPRDLKTS